MCCIVFKKFLKNGDNKECMSEIIEEVFVDMKSTLEERILYFATSGTCSKITKEHSSKIQELRTVHEEADSKVVYLVKHASTNADTNQHKICVVRSSSRDTDIPIILLSCFTIENTHVFIDNGTGKSRRLLDMEACNLSRQEKKALVGFHAFTGNDCIACFFSERETNCWQHVEKNPIYLEGFGRLGCHTEVTEELNDKLEAYVCLLYVKEDVIALIMHDRRFPGYKHINKNKVPDLSNLLPCKDSLQQHFCRANYVTESWRKAEQQVLQRF